MDGHLLRYNQKVTYGFCDLETFNLCLNFRHNRPWQAGILKVRGEKILEAHDVRIATRWEDAPHLKIGEEAAKITRFNQFEHDKLALPAKEAFEKFWPILQEVDYIIMHNGLKFDLYLLKGYAELMGVPWKWMLPKIIDTKSIAQGVKMGINWNPKDGGSFLDYQYRMANIYAHGIKTSLKNLSAEYGIEYDPELAHDAIYDLKVNLAVWNKLKFQIEI